MFEFQEALQRGCDNEDYYQDMLLNETGTEARRKTKV